ncbi:MAG TPA: type I DNA topoisomerase [Desulfotomaculum sp.]|nr:MAG: DNA topoisomerase [Desulfotomaculum sp. 46_80]KUK85255.1 MAG: DNA topoisomerase [Desulfofundulus kuznetsovii]HAG11131.1 type I DNA topoisomerase [Desulfotomaculum sp.]HBY03241.1 type I DNA topoisomerase [Desulfotomaculum sp.]
MTKTLVIVESPTKARSLSKFLGSKYTVKASMGHVRDLPRSSLGIQTEDSFQPKYITIRGKGEIIKDLKSAVKKVDCVLLAPDPDREGEAIAWHLREMLKLKDSPCRVEFNEVTKQAVQKAIKNPREIDFNRVNSQQARRILDRLVGYNLSPLLWQKVKNGLSAGRVQSVAIRLICDRENEIESFLPEEYWTITVNFAQKDGVSFEAKLYKINNEKAVISDKKQVDKIVKDLTGVSYRVKKITTQEKTRYPSPPFTTSTLQQEAYHKLNYTARRTMGIVQQLYEGLDVGEKTPVGLVTYIRTDSTRISESAQTEAVSFLKEKFGQEFVSNFQKHAVQKGKIQDAHEAIRPTSIYREPETVKKYLSRDQYKLYKLIWSRFAASQMSPALIETTSVDLDTGIYLFRTSGSVIKFPGFMRVYIESGQDELKEFDVTLPKLFEGDLYKAKSLAPKQHFTQPPPRYTDATLIKTLEEKGIGRPSTYAPIVETILRRGYVNRLKKQFMPTELGKVVVDLLKNHFHNIIDVEFTAMIEEKLDKVEEGKLDWVEMIRDFYFPFRETVETAAEKIEKVMLQEEQTEEKCIKCGRNMVIKFGRHGKFLACPGFPECRYLKPLVASTGVPCPQCEGELVVRQSKKGRRFFGCSRYPECNFVTWYEPSPEKCPRCGGLMVSKQNSGGHTRLSCINAECGFNSEAENSVPSRKADQKKTKKRNASNNVVIKKATT